MKTPFKMKGWSPFTQKDHPKKESPPEHKDLKVTAEMYSGRASEKKADIADRIEFLRRDIKSGKISTMEGGKKITELRKALIALKK